MSRLAFLNNVGPRLPRARPLGGDAVRRRGAAHPARVADRLGADRRDVRARRAVDRPAPARQRPAARHAQAPARPRQQRDRRRARPGRDLRRPTTSSTWGRARASTAGRSSRRARPRRSAARTHSLTGQYLAGRRQIPMPARRHRVDPERMLTLEGARGNNLQALTLRLPVGLFVCVTGVSGSGKSTLINDTLYHAVARHLYGSTTEPAPYDDIEGHRALRQGDQRRPEPDRPHAALAIPRRTPGSSRRSASSSRR